MLAFFIRHAESESNAVPDRDLPEAEGDRLSPLGREQAELAARHLGELGVTRLWASSMRRARQTAVPIAAELGLEVEVSTDLVEIREGGGYGELGSEEQRARRWSERMLAEFEGEAAPPDGAETFADVLDRVARVKAALLDSGSERVLAVSHGIFLRFFFADSLLGEDLGAAQARRLWQLRTLNCGLSAFEHRTPGDPLDPAESEWRCLTWMARPWDQP